MIYQNLFPLDDIDFDNVHKESLKSRCIQACNLYNSGETIRDISVILKLSESCIKKNILKKGLK